MQSSVFLKNRLFRLEGFALILAAIVISGCDMKSDEKKPAPAAPEGTVSESAVDPKSLEGTMKVDVVGGDPEKYLVQFSWPKLSPVKKIRIRLDRVLTEISSDQSFFTHTVAHNATYTYSFDVLGNNRNVEETFRKSVMVPLDYVVKNQPRITAATEIIANRAYFESSNPLLIGNFNTILIVNELHSQDGVIETFPLGDGNALPKAGTDQNGRTGGNLNIQAKSLTGRLKIIMRGEDGGTGSDGQPFSDRAKAGKPAGEGYTVSHGGEYPDSMCVSGENAGNGDPGLPGRDGNRGGDGGSTGDIRISIEKYIPLNGVDGIEDGESPSPVQIFQYVGNEGSGGKPGPPQQGGLPGPGNSGKDWDCKGDPGAPGADGGPGGKKGNGTRGAVGSSCLYIASENINECTQ